MARISVLNGEVSVRRGDSGDVVAAAINGPLMANDSILTSSSSRVEIQLDWANLLRVGPNSEVRFTGLDVRGYQIQVAAGTVMFRVLRPSQAQAEVDTPSVAIHPLGQGTYRISVREDGTSEITVRNGEAEIFSPHGSERLSVGRTMYARGPASDPEFQEVQTVQRHFRNRAVGGESDNLAEVAASFCCMGRVPNGKSPMRNQLNKSEEEFHDSSYFNARS